MFNSSKLFLLWLYAVLFSDGYTDDTKQESVFQLVRHIQASTNKMVENKFELGFWGIESSTPTLVTVTAPTG